MEEPILVEIQSNDDDFVQEILTQKKNNANKQADYVYEISSQEEPMSFSVRKKDKSSIPDNQAIEA